MLKRRGRKKDVERIETEQKIQDGLDIYVRAFLTCDSDRKGFLMPLPFSSLCLFADRFKLDPVQFDFLMAVYAKADGIIIRDRRKRSGNAGGLSDEA